MRNRLSILIFALFSFLKIGATGSNHIFYSEGIVGPDRSLVQETMINGGGSFFSVPEELTALNHELNILSDSFNLNVNIFCGRYFLDYYRHDWQYVDNSDGHGYLLKSFFDVSQQNASSSSDTSSTTFLAALKPAYEKYLNDPNGKPSILLLYTESYYFYNSVPGDYSKYSLSTTFGFVSNKLSATDKLRMQYILSEGDSIRKSTAIAEKRITSYMDLLYKEFSTPLLLANTNCPLCPIHAKVDDKYFDDAGRCWVYTDFGNNDKNWDDLSGEYSHGGNDTWKQGIDVQAVHHQYYEEKLNHLVYAPWIQVSTEVDEANKKDLWFATQLSTVYALKNKYVDDQVGWQGWIPFYGSIKTGYYKGTISNGDHILNFESGLSFLFAAADLGLIKSIASGIAKVAIKKWAIDGAIELTTKQLIYRVGKSVTTAKLAFVLNEATIEGETFFRKELTNGIEVFSESTGKYIKYDKATGEVLVGTLTGDGGQKTIQFEAHSTLAVDNTLGDEKLVQVVSEEVEKGVGRNLNLIDTRTNWLNDLKTKYDIHGTFITYGLDPNSIPQNLKDKIIGGFSSTLSPAIKEDLFSKIIKSGNTTPVMKTIYQGEELYKIVPKGNTPGRSSYYVSKTVFEEIENGLDIEQKLGLPLGTYSVEYDVYKATANEQVSVFESVIAPTSQSGFTTTGGALQSLILNTDKWIITKVKTIVPPR